MASLGLKDSHMFFFQVFSFLLLSSGAIYFLVPLFHWLPTCLAFSNPAKKDHSGFSPDFFLNPHTHPGSSSFTHTETYTDANANSVLTHPTKRHSHLCRCGIRLHCLQSFLQRAVWNLSRRTGRQTGQDKLVLGIHTGTEFVLWHSL